MVTQRPRLMEESPSRKYNLITRWRRWRWRVSDQEWNSAAWKWHTPLPLRVHWSELLTWITQLQRGWKMHFSKFLEKENWILVSSGNGCFRSLWYLSFFKLNIHNSINWFSYDMVSTALIFLIAHLRIPSRMTQLWSSAHWTVSLFCIYSQVCQFLRMCLPPYHGTLSLPFYKWAGFWSHAHSPW